MNGHLGLTEELGESSLTTRGKNRVLAQPGRAPWYTVEGRPLEAYVIGIAGGSASGKTRVAQEILKSLNVPSVLVVSQDSFYKSLTPEESKRAFNNEYDFDCPGAFDWETLRECVSELKQMKSVEIPVYSFVEHQRTKETQYLYGASVIILEGLFVLSDPDLRKLIDMKVFVQCDSDLMLARRIRRDIIERGRDVQGIITQYLKFVKPSFDDFILPTSRHADVIVPGASNTVAIDLIVTHVRRQLADRALSHRQTLTSLNGCQKDSEGHEILPPTVTVLEQTPQLLGVHTVLRDVKCTREDFIHFATRLSVNIVEEALRLLPCPDKTVMTPTGNEYHGKQFHLHLCGISIQRSGQCFDRGLRRVIRDAVLGALLIQQDDQTGEPLLFNASLPPRLKKRETASKTYVLLSDSQIGTAAAIIMAIRVLLDHGVKEDHIIVMCFVIAQSGGVHALAKAFPCVRIVTSAVDSGLEQRELPIQEVDPQTGLSHTRTKKCWAILPGVGNFGNRYFGTSV